MAHGCMRSECWSWVGATWSASPPWPEEDDALGILDYEENKADKYNDFQRC